MSKFFSLPVSLVSEIPRSLSTGMNEEEWKVYIQCVESYRLTPTSWMKFHWAKDSLFLVPLFGKDFKLLLELIQIRNCTGKDLKAEDIEDFSLGVTNGIDDALIKCSNKAFVKLSAKSPKKGMLKIKSCSTVLEVLNYVTSSKEIAMRGGSYDTEYICICPWMRIPLEKEWRVFVRNRCIIGISQQCCYHRLGKRDVAKDIDLIFDLCNQKFLEEFPFEEASLDVGVVGNQAHLIEANPPTGWCSSGASLFDCEKLTTNIKDIPILIY
jgi:hypothetical protein